MNQYFRGAKIIYIRDTPCILIGKSIFALCSLCGEPVDDRQKKSARFHKRCALTITKYKRKYYRRNIGFGG